MHRLRLRGSTKTDASSLRPGGGEQDRSSSRIIHGKGKRRAAAAASTSSSQHIIQHVGADIHGESRPAEWHTAADGHGRLPAIHQQSPQLELPDVGFGSSNDFRTSLILPELTARFAMLRAKDGSVLPIAEMQSQLRLQRETGALTAQEEQAVLDQYRLQSRQYAGEFSPTQIGGDVVKHPRMTPSGSHKSLQNVQTETPPQRPGVAPRQLILDHQRSVSSSSSGGPGRAARSPTQVAGGYKTRISQRHRTPSIDMNGSHDEAILAQLQSPPVSAPSSTSTHNTASVSGWSHAMSNISSNSTNTTSASSSTALAFTPSSATTNSSAAFPSPPLLPSPAMSQAEFYAARDAARGNSLFSGNAVERDILYQVTAHADPTLLASPDMSSQSDGVSVPIVLSKHSRPRTRSLARTRSPVPPPAATAEDIPVPALPNGVQSSKQLPDEYDPYNPIAYQSDTSPKQLATTIDQTAAVNRSGVPMLSRQQAHRISRALVDIEQNLLQQGLVHVPPAKVQHSAFGSPEIQKEWDDFAETYTDVTMHEQMSHTSSSVADSHGISAFLYDDTELIDPPLLWVPLHEQAGLSMQTAALRSPNLLSVASTSTTRDSGQSSIGSSTIVSIYGGLQTPSPLTPQVANLSQTPQPEARIVIPFSSPRFPPPTSALPPLPSQREAETSPPNFTTAKFQNLQRDSFASVSSSFQGSYGQLSPTETFCTSFPHFAESQPESQQSRRVASNNRDIMAQGRDASTEEAEIQKWLQQAAEISGLDIKDLVQIQEVLSTSQDSKPPIQSATPAEAQSSEAVDRHNSHTSQLSEDSVLIRAALAAEQAALAAERNEKEALETASLRSSQDTSRRLIEVAEQLVTGDAPPPVNDLTTVAIADVLQPFPATLQSPLRNLSPQDYQSASPAAVAAYVEAANNKATIALKGATALTKSNKRAVTGHAPSHQGPTHSRVMSGSDKVGSISRKKSVRQLRIGSPALVQTSVNLDNTVNLGFGKARNTPSPGPDAAMLRTSHDALTTAQQPNRRSLEAGSLSHTSGSISRPRKDSLTNQTPVPAASTFSSPSSTTQAHFHSPNNNTDLPTSSLHGSFRRMLTKLKRRRGTSNDAALIPNPIILSPNAGKRPTEKIEQKSQGDMPINRIAPTQYATIQEPQSPNSDTFGELKETAPLRFGMARGDVISPLEDIGLDSKLGANRTSEASIDSMQKLYQAATALGLDSDKVQELLTAAGYDKKPSDTALHQAALPSIQEAPATPVVTDGSIRRAPSRRKAPPIASNSVIEAANVAGLTQEIGSSEAQPRHEQSEGESRTRESLDDVLPRAVPRLQRQEDAPDTRTSVSAQIMAVRDAQSIYGLYDYDDADDVAQDQIVVASGLLPLPTSARPQRASMVLSAGTDLTDLRETRNNRKSRVQLTEYANGDIAFNIVRSLRIEPDTHRDTMYGAGDPDLPSGPFSDSPSSARNSGNARIALKSPASPDPMRLLVKHPLGTGHTSYDRRHPTSDAPIIDVYDADEDQIAALMETLSRGLDQGQFDVSRSPG